MNSDQCLATAYLWLFSAGIDDKQLDAAGETLAVSLGTVLHEMHMSGKCEAAQAFLKSRPSGEYEVENEEGEPTGRYNRAELEGLLRLKQVI